MFKMCLMMCMLYLIVMFMLYKWEKTLLIVISLEMVSLILMTSMFMSSGFHGSVILIFSFFISEALILMSSLYFMLRLFGLYTSSILLTYCY